MRTRTGPGSTSSASTTTAGSSSTGTCCRSIPAGVAPTRTRCSDGQRDGWRIFPSSILLRRSTSSSMRRREAATPPRRAPSSSRCFRRRDGARSCTSARPTNWPASHARRRTRPFRRARAVVAVGGDGTLNTVAQAAHAAGCAMGVVPQGTFNYFARTHGIPADPADAIRLLLHAAPLPVQVAGINDRVFLVNASLGLYPDLLEDREAYKARFGRSRSVAFVAACATLLGAQRRLRLHIETGGTARDVDDPDALREQQPPAAAAVGRGAGRHPGRHAGRRQHGARWCFVRSERCRCWG